MNRTVRQLALQSHRLDRINAEVLKVVSAMRRDGLSLHLEYRRAIGRWWLSDGSEVAAEVAALVIKHSAIVACGDGLFGNVPAQTYRFRSLTSKED